MKPQSIRMFDYFYLGALALGVVNFFLSIGDTRAQLAADPSTAGLGEGFLYGSIAFSVLISLLLWYFVSRRASNVAKWILVVFFVIGVLFIPSSLATLSTVPMLLTLVTTALQAVAVFYLFRADAKAYLKGETVDPTTFD